MGHDSFAQWELAVHPPADVAVADLGFAEWNSRMSQVRQWHQWQ
jgi:hypothetical protein